MFYQYVQTAALNQQRTQYVSIFTTELFAHYLYIRCLSVMKCHQFTQMSSTHEVQRHTKYIADTNQLLIADVLLLRPIHKSSVCHYKSLSEQGQNSTTNQQCATEPSTSHLAELLQHSAVEHLTTHRQLETQQFGSVSMIVTTDFEALYAYKRGDYHRCLWLSTQNVHTLYAHGKIWMADVSTFPEFIQLMDDDIVSLTALTLIVNPACRLHSSNICINQLTLSLYLMTQC